MADSDVVRTGRGGAGNFWSKKDVADMEKAASNEDLQAQITKQDPDSSNQENSDPQPKYIPIGRGGAGNFQSPTDSPSPELTKFPTNTLPKPDAEPSHVPRGRGGAGNWFESTHTREKRIAEEERRKEEEREKVEMMVRESIEKQLRKPEASYGCGPGSERGVRVGKSRLGATLGDESLGV